jgi:chromate transporter
MTSPAAEVVPPRTIAINWTRIGITGFGGPRTHIALLRRLAGAGPAAIGAIFGAAIPLTAALRETWEFVVLGVAAVALLLARRSIVSTLVGAALVGMALALAGVPVPR